MFAREGDDLVVERRVNSRRRSGMTLDVPTVEGNQGVKVPAGIQPGTKIRLKGFGFPHMGGSGRGDLFVRIGISVPEQLDGPQRELIEELAKKGL